MKLNNKVVGNVYEIRDLVSDEAIVPQFCSKTEENAKLYSKQVEYSMENTDGIFSMKLL